MKNRINRRNRMLSLLATISLVAISLLCIFAAPQIAVGLVMATGTVVGGVELTEQESKLLNVITAEFKSELDKFKSGYITQASLETSLTAKFNELSKELPTDKLKQLQDSLDELGLTVKSLKENGGKISTIKSIPELLAEKQQQLAQLASSKGSLTLDIKANVLRAGLTDDTQAYRVPGIGEIAYRRTALASLFPHISLPGNHHGVIRYTDQEAITRGADVKAEGAAYAESAISWIEKTLTVEKITDSIPVSHEALTDIDFVAGEIEKLLKINLMLKEDQQLYSGTGLNNQLKGVYTTATAFNAGAYAGPTTPDASIFDLVAVLATSISNGKESKYIPNVALINPTDALRMKLKKDSNNQYIIPPFVTADGKSIAGITLIEHPLVTANTLLLGDFNWGSIYDVEGYTVEIGFVNDQFTKDLATIKARKREALLIRNADTDAYLKVTDVDAALTAITTV